MPYFYIPGNEPGPAYEFDVDPGSPYVAWVEKPVPTPKIEVTP